MVSLERMELGSKSAPIQRLKKMYNEVDNGPTTRILLPSLRCSKGPCLTCL